MGPQANQQYPHAKQQESRGRRRRGRIGGRGEGKAGEGELIRERCFRGSQAILKYACGTEHCSRQQTNEISDHQRPRTIGLGSEVLKY